MHALPLLCSTLTALVIAPALLRGLNRSGCTARNYRGRDLPYPFGALALLAVPAALVPLALIGRLGGVALFHREAAPVALYCSGVILLGALDDRLPQTLRAARAAAAGGAGRAAKGEPRGLRGHARALLRGEPSTGAAKAAGSLGLALLALSQLGLSGARLALAVAVVVLSTHVWNLLDLRPGRAVKALALLGGALTALSGDLRALWSLGLFGGTALVAGAYDVREHAMLGDTGAGLLGGLAGLWLVLTLGRDAQLAALALLVATALYGELRSITGLVERTPLLRGLDSLGRPS